MAYDKVIDSAQLDTALTTMANAIREKTGGAESLEWVANKGFADIISGIESGDSLPIGAFYIEHGSFTPASTIQNYNLFGIEDLRSIASKNNVSSVSQFSLIVRIKNLSYKLMSAAVMYVDFWVNYSGSLQGVTNKNVYLQKNLSGTLSAVTISGGEATMNKTSGLTLNTSSSYQFAPTEYVWSLIGYTGV